MTDPSTCPACGAANACAMATGNATDCWCFGVTVNPSAVAALPEAARGTVCLCQRCATASPENRAVLPEAGDAD